MRKTTWLLLLGVPLAYATVELVSFLSLAATHWYFPSAFIPDIEGDYLADKNDEDLEDYFHDNYDPLLGWDNQPGTEVTQKNCLGQYWTESFDADGARSTPRSFDTTLIASYGDSYVKGGDVNNDQTWQFRLAEKLGVGVKNYAVGAFDPYQAVLKLKVHFSEGNIYPITVLGINEENAARVVNLYRPFNYSRVRAKFAFKPGLACYGETCKPIANLLQPDVRTIDGVKRIAREARQWDYWARHKPFVEYPWSVNLLKLARYAWMRETTNEYEPVWLELEAIAAMHLIVADFQQSARAAGSVPVVLFIPTRPKKDVPPSYRFFKKQTLEEYPDLTVIDVADSDFDTKRFKLKPSGGCHPSPYGHSVIAEAVRVGIQGLLDTRAVKLNAATSTK